MSKYVLSKKILAENVENLSRAYRSRGLNFDIFYSVKSNNSPAVLNQIAQNCFFEVVSAYEWEMVKAYHPKQLVLNGPGKSVSLIEDIHENVDILYLNIDNDTDLDYVSKLSLKKLKIGLRVYFNSEKVWNRFGYNIDSSETIRLIRKIEKFANISGFHFHFSTNKFDIENYHRIFASIKKLDLPMVEYIDLGGGLPSADEFHLRNDVYSRLPELTKKYFPDKYIISEAGRHLVSNAIRLETQVISKKVDDGKMSISLGANIMHFQCFFDNKFYLEHKPKSVESSGEAIIADVYGNSCMQIDCLAKDFLFAQEPQLGDTILIHNIGAYSQSQASNFISPIPQTYEE